MRILITDANERASLALARSLGRLHEVEVVGSGIISLAGASRFVMRHHRAPSPVSYPRAFASAVELLVLRRKIDLVLPVGDAACQALLDGGPLPLSIASRTAYERLSDKSATAALAREHGIDVPRGEEVTGIDAALGAGAALGWPVVLKPAASVVRGADGGARKLSVAVAADAAALRRAWSEAACGRALIQEYVEGWGEGVFILRWQGKTRAVFGHRRLRENPPAGGVSVLRESCAVDARLVAGIEAVLDAVGYQGVAMAEFKTNGRRVALMEFNARFWGSLQLAIDAGVDFPHLLIEAVQGIDSGLPPDYECGVRSRWLLGDVDHAIALGRGAINPHGETGIAAAARALLRPTGSRCRWEVLRASDPLPFLHELVSWLRALLMHKSRHSSPR
jgi:predicted ATP-grasp superfamily ATP-dependent carboligase